MILYDLRKLHRFWMINVLIISEKITNKTRVFVEIIITCWLSLKALFLFSLLYILGDSREAIIYSVPQPHKYLPGLRSCGSTFEFVVAFLSAQESHLLCQFHIVHVHASDKPDIWGRGHFVNNSKLYECLLFILRIWNTPMTLRKGFFLSDV